MAKYTDHECIICKEKFKDSDDIVVCPECGTPYHRECYLSEGKCINTELHEKKKSYTEQKAEEPKKCPVCNAENAPHAFICDRCGSSLLKGIEEDIEQEQDFEQASQENRSGFTGFGFDPTDKYCGLDPHEKITEDISVEEAADFVGTNVPYYLMLFKRMKDTGKKITFNLVCILFPQFYFAHRKMLLEAFAVILLTSLLSIPAMLYAFAVMEMPMRFVSSDALNTPFFAFVMKAANYISLLVNVLTCFFGNWLYMRHMKKKIGFIKSNETDYANIRNRIAISGGTSVPYLITALVAQFAVSAAITFTFLKF